MRAISDIEQVSADQRASAVETAEQFERVFLDPRPIFQQLRAVERPYAIEIMKAVSVARSDAVTPGPQVLSPVQPNRDSSGSGEKGHQNALSGLSSQVEIL